MKPNEAVHLKDRFTNLGIQYYIAARASAFCRHVPVCANLYHHSIESILKADFEIQISRKFQHDLPGLWTVFKRAYNDRSLDQFDSLIEKLHQWEEIRYPGQPWAQGMTLQRYKSIAVQDGLKFDNSSYLYPQKHYVVCIEEIDEFIKELCTIMNINPQWFKFRLHSEEAVKIYEDGNRHLIY